MKSIAFFGRGLVNGYKKADKGTCRVVYDRENNLFEVEKQLKDEKVYESVHFNKTLIEGFAYAVMICLKV